MGKHAQPAPEERDPLRAGTPLEARLDHWIDVEGECWVWAGALGTGGYARINVDGRATTVHRVVYELVAGEPIPEGMMVNHLCGVRRCCRPDHLELASPSQNSQYLTTLPAHNTSGYRGVRYDIRRAKWQARLQVNRKTRHLGYFDTAEEANQAAIAGRAKYHDVLEYADWQAAA